jgi:hypothetical protein
MSRPSRRFYEADKQAIAKEAAERQEMMQRVSDRIGQEAAGDPQRYRRHGANRTVRGRTSGAGHRPRHLADLDTRSGRTVNVMELSPIAAALVCLEWASAHLLGLWACRGSVVVSAERRRAEAGIVAARRRGRRDVCVMGKNLSCATQRIHQVLPSPHESALLA